MDLEVFETQASAWLAANAVPRTGPEQFVWGRGSDSVAMFQNLTMDEERAYIDEHRDWLRRKADAGFANLCWESEWGGRGFPPEFEEAFADLEAQYDVPPAHESIGITTGLIAPTIRAVGTDWQQQRFLAPMLRGDELWCQLFSEPAAGSDLAGLQTRARHDGSSWILDGQKVWTSGAQFADFGYIICRSDPAARKHRGLTAFIVPMDTDGVEVRPLRQMTGGATFNEVFLTEVRIGDEYRLGAEGDGWRVALTTLGFERNATGRNRDWPATAARLIATAQQFGVSGDPVVRQLLARAVTYERLREYWIERMQRDPSATPGAEGSIGKLVWTETLQHFSRTIAAILGPRLAADTGEWGTFAWTEFLYGTAGYRIAGGTDEIQRNIIAERLLGLPRDPRPETPA
jgi:alkylation response protein AidB-like acyl-CoA dehydrogenase